MKIIKVVCGIIWRDGKILLARKRPEKVLGGYWEFPGGKVEPNEEHITTLQRELLEELGLEISNIRYFATHLHAYETISIELIAFQADFKDATFQLKDHDKVEFVALSSLNDYRIAQADQYFLDRIKS